ncbi:MAG TPA: formyltransferase family protein [Bryobacteraceae bacterium]|nr:formyltransferase family protein [Bryobacteraceae bacterium]
MKRYRLVYAGCDFFASVFDSLLARADIDVVLCLTGERHTPHVSNVARLARRNKIPVHYGGFTPRLIRRIRSLSADAMLCASYSYRVPVADLAIAFNLNLHPTLLPHGRGPNPIPYLIGEHSRFSGLTIHEMIHGFDQGAILAQQAVPVRENWGYHELALAMCAHAPTVVNQVFDNLEELFATRRPQEAGSYWPRPSREDRTVRWTEPAARIAAKSRRFGALGVLCLIDGEEQKITHPIAFVEVDHDFDCGRVILHSSGVAYVAARGGIVRIETGRSSRSGPLPLTNTFWHVRSRAFRALQRLTSIARPA